MATSAVGAVITILCRPILLVWWSCNAMEAHAATIQASNESTTSSLSVTLSTATRRLVEGLQCDLEIYNSFIESDEGQDIFIKATMCESRIVYLKNKRAGWYGPVDQEDLFTVMCSDECLQSDELHKKALSLSRCTCAQVSAETFVKSDFCLENSARLLCTHLSECGHWGCKLEDFNCLRYEWDRLYPCDGIRTSQNIVVLVLGVILATTLLS